MTDISVARPGPTDADQARLLAAAQAGDRRAMDRLLRRYQPQVQGICRRMSGNEADAADAAQEALIAIVRGLGSFDGRSRLTTWVHRVTVNACLDGLRHRSRVPAVPVGDIEVVSDRTWSDPGRRFDDVLADRQLLDRAVAALPEPHRTVLVLRERCELDYAEIAEVLDVPVGTVRSRLARARAHVADTHRATDRDPDLALAG